MTKQSIKFNFNLGGGSIHNSNVAFGMDNTIVAKQDEPRSERNRPLKPGPWRIFLSHTSELRLYPKDGSYIDKAEEGVIAAGHVPIDMKHFPAVDEPAAAYDSRRVEECEVYVGIYGLRWGTPVLGQPTISCTEQEFDHATAYGLTRLIFTIDTTSTELGLPPDALLDPEHGQRQQAFLQRVRNSGLIVKPFRNPEDLKALVERSLRELADSLRATA
ncbi:MAG: DUF4062 domain-containing protein [Cyanobium sp.]